MLLEGFMSLAEPPTVPSIGTANEYRQPPVVPSQ